MSGALFKLAMVILLPIVAGSASATSFVSIPPHNPDQACKAISAVFDEMTGKRKVDRLWPLYYTDQLGHIGYNQRDKFIKNMVSSNGKPDQYPAKINGVWPVGKRTEKDSKALYVISITRFKWELEREGAFDPMQTEPEGYDVNTSFWLVTFSGDDIQSMREGYQYFDFIDYNKRLKGCGNA